MTIADPCATLEPQVVLAQARAVLEAQDNKLYEDQATRLTQALTCPPAESGFELESAQLLAAMADDLLARGHDGGQQLLARARQQYAAATQVEDPELAFAAATAYIELSEVVEQRDDESSGRKKLHCQINSEGVCIYHEKKTDRGRPFDPFALQPYTDAQRELLMSYEIHEAHAAPSERLRERRYRHIRLRMDHNDYESALPLLERYILDYDDHVSATWAVSMLLDALFSLARATDATDDRLWTVTLAWIERLPTLPLYPRAESAWLRESLPLIHRAAMWQLATKFREQGMAALTGEFVPDPSGPQLSGFRRAGMLFLEIDSTFPDHDRADTLLWNAADCFWADWDPRMAIRVYATLLERYPDSVHAKDTLSALAELELGLFEFERAADHRLQYAELYPKDSRTPDLILDAIELYEALGPNEKTREATQRLEAIYISHYARKDPAQVARFVWSRRPLEPRKLLRFAQEFETTHAQHWDAGRVEVTRTLVELNWDLACRERLEEGSCVAKKTPRIHSTCSVSGQPFPRIRERSRKHAEKSESMVARGIELSKSKSTFESSESKSWPEEEGVLAILDASLLYHTLEPAFEAYLLAGPDAVDANSRASELDAGYRELATLGAPSDAVRAHARRALIWELLANAQLVEREGQCIAATPAGERSAELATRAYQDCLAAAVAAQHFDASAHRCERALAELDLSNNPPLVEFVGTPGTARESHVSAVGVLPDPLSMWFDPWSLAKLTDPSRDNAIMIKAAVIPHKTNAH